MDTNWDLETASREVLLGIIAQQQAVIQEQQTIIAQLQRRIEVLEGKAKPGGSRGMPGIKPPAGRRPPRKEGPRKPRTHGFARKSMTPTPPGGACGGVLPECGAGLAGDWVQRTREVIEVPMAPVEVTEHVFIARTCPICQQRRTPSATLDGVWSWAASGWASTCSA